MPNPLPRPTPAMLRAAGEIVLFCTKYNECGFEDAAAGEFNELPDGIASIIARCLSEDEKDDTCHWVDLPHCWTTGCGRTAPTIPKSRVCKCGKPIKEVRDGE